MAVGKKALGKSFGSLLPQDFDTSVMLDKGERVQKLSTSDISADPSQPRKSFDHIALDELAQSIKRYGILQPLVVTETDPGKYTIIAGERRFRAAKKAGLTHVPALVRSLKEIERLEIGLIENMQRVDLSPMEQALSIARLNEQFSMSLQDIALRLGKAHTTIVNTVRLLQLPDYARKALEDNKLSEGHARAVLSLKSTPDKQKILTSLIIDNGWSVRQAEAWVQQTKGKTSSDKDRPEKTISTQKKYIQDISLLENVYGAKAKVSAKGKSVNVQLTFKSNKEYTQFMSNLTDKI